MNNIKLGPLAVTCLVVAAALGLGAGYAWGNNGNDMSHHMGDGSESTATKGTSLGAVADKASATEHNRADEMFAMMTVEHHTQAIEMTNLVDSRASSQEVKDLAAKINAAQTPEIDNMAGWLEGWGTSGDMIAMRHDMPGYMSGDDMKSLKTARGVDFDKMFLQMMIEHHEGAITMADTELEDGKNADALALATSIAVSQHAEIQQMKAMLQ
jgi:uncharacterized protein (DUF305 family)